MAVGLDSAKTSEAAQNAAALELSAAECIGSEEGMSEDASLPGVVVEEAVASAANSLAANSSAVAASETPVPVQQRVANLAGNDAQSTASSWCLPAVLSEQLRQLQQLQGQQSKPDLVSAATFPSLTEPERSEAVVDHIADQLDEVIQQHYFAQTGTLPPEGLAVPRTLRPKTNEQPSAPLAAPPIMTSSTRSVWSYNAEEDTILAGIDGMQQELDKIKADTMHSMVHTVDAIVRDQQVKSTFIYLTNRQAGAFDVSKMPLVRGKLGIKEPKMVIRLMPSRFGPDYWNAFPYWNTSKNSGRFPCKQVPELNIEEQELTEHRLILLVKDVLLPLAMEAHALVIGNSRCALVAAFARVSAPLVQQMGDGCPFRLLIFAYPHAFHLKANEQGSVVQAFRQKSKRWSSMESKLHEALKQRFGDDEAYWPQQDLHAGEYSLVMFESLGSNGMLMMDVSRDFENAFIQSMSGFLPVIALQTYGTQRMGDVPSMADHANRGLPLFLLDSRRRMPLLQATAPQDYNKLLQSLHDSLSQFSSALHNKPGCGTTDAYTISLLAYVKGHIDQALSLDAKSNDADVSPEDQRMMWLFEAIRTGRNGLNRVQHQDRIKNKMRLPQSMIDLEEALLVGATDTIISYVGADIEWESKFMLQRCSDAIEDVATARTWEELKLKLDANWLKLRGRTFHRYTAAEKFVQEKKWCRLHDFHKDTASGRQRLVIDLECPDRPDLKEAVSRLVGLLSQEYNFSKKYDEAKNTKKALKAQDVIWTATFDVLKSKNVHAGNLHDLSQVRKNLFSLAQIDRLPAKNSLEALLLLRHAWDLVDLFQANASFYKVCGKLSYIFNLILGVAIVVLSVLPPVYPDDINSAATQKALLGLALVASLITGATLIVDPATKWLMLRGSALALEAEIWRFRTRVGQYQGASGNGSSIGRMQAERLAEEAFQATTLELQEAVQQSPGLKDTSFYSTATATHAQDDNKPTMDGRTKRVRLASWYTHGQYDVSRKLPEKTAEMNNFHSPAGAPDYIKYRLVPQMQFYQRRLPRYARRHRLFQTLALMATVVNAMLAAIGEPTWTAIVSSISGAFAAWQEFHDVTKKLDRYSTAVDRLSSILLWWQSLPEVDQSSSQKVEYLVDRTEEVLGGERQAWLSDTLQAAKIMKERRHKDSREESNSQAQARS